MRVGKLSGAVGTYAATDPELERIACERLGLEPAPDLDADPPARPPCRAAHGARGRRVVARHVRARDPPSRAHRGRARCRSRSAAARRARRRCRTSATRSSPSGSAGSRASCAAHALVGLENVALWHERDISHSSAERVVIPDAFLALDYMLDRFAWLVEGLVVRPERMRRNLEASHYLFFSQRVLLALVESGLARDDAYRLVQRDAMRAWEEELDFRELCRADDEIAVARRPRRRPSTSARTRATSTPSSPVSTRPQGGATFMPETAHVASGKVREIYALDDERLLLVASDRISTFDVVLPTEIPDKGRVLTGLSGFWFTLLRADRPEPHARDPRRRPLDGVPPARDAADRVRRARLPRRLGLEGLPRDRLDVCGHALPEGLRESDQLPEPIFTPATKAQTATRREHHARRRRPSSSAQERLRGGRARLARAVHDSPRSTRSRAGSSSPTRSSSSGVDADGQPRARRRGADARLVALLARRRRTSPAGRRTASTSSSCATTARRSAGTRPTPGPELPDEVVADTRAKYIEAFERLTDDSVPRLPRRPDGGARVRATVLVRPKPGILDPQGEAVELGARAARLRGRGRAGRQGRSTSRSTPATQTEARAQVEKMCEQLLANPLIESYEVEMHG